MNKSELTSVVSDSLGLTKADSAKAIVSIIEAITMELSNGGNVVIPGFGSFIVRDRAARKGRNPKTGAEIQIKASKIPAFKAGKNLKEMVNLKR